MRPIPLSFFAAVICLIGGCIQLDEAAFDRGLQANVAGSAASYQTWHDNLGVADSERLAGGVYLIDLKSIPGGQKVKDGDATWQSIATGFCTWQAGLKRYGEVIPDSAEAQFIEPPDWDSPQIQPSPHGASGLFSSAFAMSYAASRPNAANSVQMIPTPKGWRQLVSVQELYWVLGETPESLPIDRLGNRLQWEGDRLRRIAALLEDA